MDGIRLANVVGIIKCRGNAILPESKSKLAACFDLYSCEDSDVVIHSGETKVFHTGIKLDLHKSKKALIYSRSGLAAHGIIVTNAPGIIDPDYQGEVKVILSNIGKSHFSIGQYTRIAQMEIVPRFNESISLLEVDDFSSHPTERGEKGLGSTGI